MKPLSCREVVCVATACLGALASGCASYVSSQALGFRPAHGLVYYLPRRPIIAQVVVTADSRGDKVETPSIAAASAIPDIAHQYILTTSVNLISENHVSLAVSSTGLLESANSNVTSGLSTILSNLATAGGTIHGARTEAFVVSPSSHQQAPSAPADQCLPGQTYNLVFWPRIGDASERLCSFQVTLEPILAASQGRSSAERRRSDGHYVSRRDHGSGVYYRTELPYLVTFRPKGASDASDSVSFIASSPDEAPAEFLPIQRTLFANNNVTLTMKDGELASFDQDNAGEFVGLTSVPATVLGNYFTAISNIVPKRTSANAADVQGAIDNLERQSCKNAFAANPLEPGMSSSEEGAAISNIKTACTAASTGASP